MDRNSLLVIRGGAVGDFILTLPAIAALRKSFPDSRLEIIGYRHICSIAEGRWYADAVRSIEYAPMARFFARGAVLDSELAAYFSRFGQIVSYLFDPDGIFEENLRRCGVKHMLSIDPRVDGTEHASHQLARPLENLAIFVEDFHPKIFPSDADHAKAQVMLRDLKPPLLFIHPGSGSPRKNWPAGHWLGLARQLSRHFPSLIVTAGECESDLVDLMKRSLPASTVFLCDTPLPELAAAISGASLFIGNDTGISHLAAAVGAPCLLLFGPTDPDVWAPPHEHVRILRAPDGCMPSLEVSAVLSACHDILNSKRNAC